MRPQTVRTTNVDVAGLTVSGSTLTVTEGGTERTFTVKLTSKPAAAVTVTATSADGDEVRLARNAGDADARAFAASKELVFTANDWNDAQTLRVAAVDDDRDDPASLSVAITLDTASGGDSHYNGLDDETVDVTKNDDDATPTLTLARSPSAITESGGVATVMATLSGGKSGEAVTVTVAASPGTGAVAADFALSTAKTLTIAAGSTDSAGTVTVTANGNDVDSPDKQVTISGTVAGGHGLLSSPSSLTLTLTDDETLPTVTLALSDGSISEQAGETTVTATLSGKSSQAVTVTVAASPGTGAVAADFGLSTAMTLTIAAGATVSTGTVTVTANGNDVDAPNKEVTVSATVVGGNGVLAPAGVTLTLTDDETLPTVTLALSDGSISEQSGETTVTATLSGKSSEAVTVTVGAAPGTGAVAADFGLSAAKTLTIAAGATVSAGTVTVTANGNDVHSGDKSVTVSGTATGGNGVANPDNETLTLTDDETLPTVTLSLSPTSISETGGVSSVTATLSGKSSQAVTVTVAAAAGTGAVAADFDLSTAKTLTIAAGSTTSAGAVTVTANGNTVDSPDKSVTVSGTVAGGNGVANPVNQTLTLEDDDATPTATLLLSAAAIDESGTSNVTTVTARLGHGSSEAVTITVSLSPVGSTGAVAGDYTLSSTNTLTIAAGATASAGLVTVTAVDNTADEPDIQVTVSGTADGGRGVADPAGKTLTIRDDDDAPGVTLSLSVTSIWENAQPSAVSATLSHPSSAATTVTVTGVSGSFTVPSGAAGTIVIAAGNTTSSHTVPITTVDNDVDEPDRMVTVTATVANGQGAGNVTGVTLTIRDNEATPTVTLSVNPTSISESGDTATVSATLSGRSSEPTTVTVTAQANVYSVAPGAGGTIVIAAGQTANASDTAIVTAVDNDVDAADNAATVTGTAANGHGVTAAATGASLTLTDDDTAGFAVSPATSTSSRLQTTEAGGTATFTVALESEPTGDVELDVASSDATEGAVSPSSLTFTASNWQTAQTVTLTGQDDAATDGNVNYTVTLTVDQANTADAVYDALSALTVYAVNADDEYGLAVGTVTGQASESGGTARFTVALRTRPVQAVTVAVTSRDSSEGRVSPSTLTFPPGSWNVNQTVTVTGLDDDVDDGTVPWQVRLDPASGDGNYNALANVDVSVSTTDDDGPPAVTLALSPSSIDESGTANTAAVRATLSRASSAATTVTVTAVTGFYTVGSDATIVIAAGDTAAASDTAAVTAVDNTTDAPDRTPTVTATVANDRAAADSTTMAVTGAALTIRDDDAAPTATLSLNPASIAENGGTSAVSAVLSHRSSAATTVTVTAVSGFFTVPSGAAGSVVIAAGDTAAAGDTVTITAVDNDVDEPNRTATVTATVGNSQGAGSVTGETLTLEDDEAAPTVALSVSPASVSENGGAATVRATLSGRSSEATTVTVTAQAGVFTVASGAGGTIIVAAGATTTTDTATITAVDNDVDAADNMVTVAGTPTNGHGVGAATGASLTLTDDDVAGIEMEPATTATSRVRTSEDGSTATVDVTLATEPTGDVRIDVASLDTGEGTVSPSSLTFTSTNWNTAQTVTLTGVDDNPDAVDGSRNYQVTLTVDTADTADANYDALSAVTIHAVNADDELGLDVGTVSGPVTEAGGTATFTVRLVTDPALVTRASQSVTVSVSSRDASEGRVSPPSLTFTAGSSGTWNVNQTVTLTGVDDAIDDGDVAWDVRLDTSSADNSDYDGVPDVDVEVTTTDNDAAPTVALSVSPGSISENGGTATVRARLNRASNEATTVTVTGVSGLYTPGSDATIVIAAGDTAGTDTATVEAVDDAIHQGAAGRAVTVTATVANDRAAADATTMAVTGAALSLTDDEAAPNVTLSLDPASISENGGTSAVSAVLSHRSSAATTVTVTAVSGFYAVGSDATIVIAAGDTTAASDTAAIVAVDNTTDEADRVVTVTATLRNGQGTGSVSGAALTLEDDDAAPAVTLSAASPSIPENGGSTAVSAVLSHRSSAATTVTVTAVAGAYTVASGSGATIVIAAGDTTAASDTATVSAVDDVVHQGRNGRLTTVTGTAANSQATADSETVAVTGASLTLTDDESLPTVTLVLTPPTVDENGGVSAVTAALSGESGEAVTITVSASPVSSTGAGAGDYVLSASRTLTVAAGGTTSTGTVTITAQDDNASASNKQVAVSGTAAGGNGVADPTDVRLTIADDESPPTVTLALSPPSISEDGGMTRVTATLSRPSSAATTITVSGAPVTATGAAAGDYTLSANVVLIVAANDTISTGTVEITAVNDAVDEPDEERVTVSGSASNSQQVRQPPGMTLTITDDDAAPAVTLAVSSGSISEAGGTAAVSAALSHPSSAVTTVTVAAVSGLYTVGSAAAIVIAAGSTTGADTVTIEAVDDDVDNASDRRTSVTGTAQNSLAAANSETVTVAGAPLTITDDDVAAIVASRSSGLLTTEAGGTDTFTVRLATKPAGNVKIDLASSDPGEGTVSPASLIFTPTTWDTARTITLTGVDDAPSNPADGNRDYTVTLTVDTTSTADAGYDALPAVDVAASNDDDDDDAGMTVAAAADLRTTEAGGTAAFTVVLISRPGADVVIPVSSSDEGEGTVSPVSLTFGPGNWSTAQTVTVTGVDDAVDDGDVAWAVVLGDPQSTDVFYGGLDAGDTPDVPVTNADDDEAPAVALAVAPASISEAGGTATVSAVLSHPSSEATTVTVAGVEGFYTVGEDAAVVVAAGRTSAAEAAVVVTAVNDAVDNVEDRSVAVVGTALNDRGAGAVTGAELTLLDDDVAGLVIEGPGLLEVAVGEAAGAGYAVRLNSEPTAEVSVTIESDNGDVSVGTGTLAFTAGDWGEAQTVTATAASDGDLWADAALLVHRASGGGYDGLTAALPVAVLDPAATAVRVPPAGPEPMETAYMVHGQEVKVMVMPGAPEGVEVDLSSGLDSALALTIAPLARDALPESAGFALGREAADRMVVDVEAAPVPPGGLGLCLPVSPALRTAAAGRALTVLHYDGSAWGPAGTGSTDDGDGGRVCAAGVTAFSPFAVGYEDTVPEFDGTVPEMLRYVEGEEIDPVVLPGVKEGTGDPPIEYALTPELPDGLVLDLETRTLSGTPAAAVSPTVYTWTAWDVDGDEAQPQSMIIEVVAATAPGRARLKAINESILPELSRAGWDSAMEAVARRVGSLSEGGSGAPGEGLAASLAGFMRANERALEDDVSWKESLIGQSFAIALGAEGEGAGAGTGLGRSFTVWGAGDRRRLSRDVPALEWSGDLSAFHLGADVGFRSGWTAGVGVSWFESLVDYVDRSGEGPIEGEHRSRMSSVQPYAGWLSEEGARLWASVGYGSGEIDIRDEDLLPRFGRQSSDSELVAAAVGGAVRLVSEGAMRLDLKGEGQATRYEVDDNGVLIAGLSVRTQRLRVSALGSREYALGAGGGRLSPSLELGVRWDGGDGATGAGVEVGGGVSWIGAGGDLAMEVKGRTLLAHRGDLEEWGVAGGLRLEPGVDGRGWSLNVEPKWGKAGSGASRLWEEGMAGRSGEVERLGAGAEVELGYGLAAFGGFGVATPYTRLGLSQEGERSYGIGWRLNRRSSEAFELDLEGWRRERDTARSEHGVSLELRLRW